MVEAKATAKYVRLSPLKVRRVLALVRGCDVAKALALLDFTSGAPAVAIRKVIASAAANAETNHGMNRERLWVRRAYADAGPRLRWYRAGSLGRGGRIRRPMSHITVVLEERPERAAAPGRRASRRREKDGGKA